MAIDHESPFKELRLKNRRIMGGGGPEPEEEEAVAHGEQWPRWLSPLLSASFFSQCKVHADSHRSGECNMFCLDCAAAAALCSLCLAHNHRDHHTIQVLTISLFPMHCSLPLPNQTYLTMAVAALWLQIRRSSYHDVIRVSDIQRFMDIGGVQTYVINSARVVFLNERPQHKAGKGAVANICEVCSRSLLDNFRFCSLGCKVVGCSPHAATAAATATATAARRKRLRHAHAMASTSDSDNSTSPAKRSFTPSTPPPPPTLPPKRRKGIPHRAPFGSLIVEY
uniref:B box-type domain-containing protein n=1 Tax=Oryza glumipatula TaxID=40148 RepID=A0A0E0BE47_9ORYZ